MTIIPLGYAQATHVFAGASLPYRSVVTYGLAPNGGTFPNDDVALLHDAFGTRIMPMLTSGISLVQTELKYGPNATGMRVFENTPVQGGSPGPDAPPNTALLVKKRTAMGGRMNQGRFYVPGLRESMVANDGAINAADYTGIQTAFDNFLADIELEAMNMVILHNAVSDPTPVTSLEVDAKTATQRRRLRR